MKVWLYCVNQYGKQFWIKRHKIDLKKSLKPAKSLVSKNVHAWPPKNVYALSLWWRQEAGWLIHALHKLRSVIKPSPQTGQLPQLSHFLHIYSWPALSLRSSLNPSPDTPIGIGIGITSATAVVWQFLQTHTIPSWLCPECDLLRLIIRFVKALVHRRLVTPPSRPGYAIMAL